MDTPRTGRCGVTDDGALEWSSGGEVLRIEAWGSDSLRLRAWRGTSGNPPRVVSPALIDEVSPDGGGIVDVSSDEATIRHGRVAASVSVDGQVTITDVERDVVVLREPRPQFIRPPARAYATRASGDLLQVTHRFEAQAGERVYGLGQRQHGLLDQMGTTLELQHRNSEVSIPFMISSLGYGLLFNHPGTGQLAVGRNGTTWTVEAARGIDEWITCAASPSGVMANYAQVTGHAPEFPSWASGFWQSRLRYRTQAEVLAVAREYRQRGLPLDVIVIDFLHWDHFGDWSLNTRDWPDPAAMVRELESLGVRPIVSFWPVAEVASENFAELTELGLLVRQSHSTGPTAVFMEPIDEDRRYVHHVDLTNPAARRFVWSKIRDNYASVGIRNWWLDENEPEQYPTQHSRLSFAAGAGDEVAGMYPLVSQQCFAEGMTTDGLGPTVLLSRSAWAGSQRYGTALWSGDVDSSWEALRAQIPAGLNAGLSGIAWWGSDIGGFVGGDPADPEFHELLIRWFEFAVCTPICRLHGARVPLPSYTQGGAANEPWSYGPVVLEQITALLAWREAHRGEINRTMAQASATGLPPMRPLWFAFPDDPDAALIENQYMFGDDLLVCPVTAPGLASRSIYLPTGERWSIGNDISDGGRSYDLPTPLGMPPVARRVSPRT